jgi:hypothetical protein
VLGCGSDSQGSGGSGGTIIFEPGPVCTEFCSTIIGECQAFTFTEDSCVQGCEADLAQEFGVSEACGSVVAAVFVCVTALDCQEVYAWRDAASDPPSSYPCGDEIAAVDAHVATEPACGQAR